VVSYIFYFATEPIALTLCLYYHVQILFFIPVLILLGIGQGFMFTPLTNLGMYRVSKDKSGIASGLVNFSHQIGSSTGIVLDLVIATFIIRYIGATNNDITLIAILIGTVIQVLMLVYVVTVFEKSNNKYEF